jgi:hypothetical protein
MSKKLRGVRNEYEGLPCKNGAVELAAGHR